MNNVTVNGTERDWTGPKENYMEHHEVIEWWCDGGEVEWRNISRGWLSVEGGYFRTENEYRRKQREPMSGEVWMYEGDPSIFMGRKKSSKWTSLTDSDIYYGTKEYFRKKGETIFKQWIAIFEDIL